jgi:polyhydroxyalkanoate synthase
VHQVPVVVVPPQINKFYFMDLSPGRSLTEYALRRGLQFFAISWRNPRKEQRDWDLDTYGRAIIGALDAVQEITGSDQVHLFGLCAGGITTATVRGASSQDARESGSVPHVGMPANGGGSAGLDPDALTNVG